MKRNTTLELGKSQVGLSEENDKSIISELTLKIVYKDKEVEQLMKFNNEKQKRIENLASIETKRKFVSVFGA